MSNVKSVSGDGEYIAPPYVTPGTVKKFEQVFNFLPSS